MANERFEDSLICVGCHKRPSEISEYVSAGAVEHMTPEQYVVQEEGTLNHSNGHFRCTRCYLDAGMPLGVTP